MTEHGKFPGCRFCHGRGCAACDGERERAKSPPPPVVLPPPNQEEIDQMYDNFEANTRDDPLNNLRLNAA